MVKFVKYEFNLSKEQRGRKCGDFWGEDEVGGEVIK